jgi:nucleotide-binding universal stress UspA family protein
MFKSIVVAYDGSALARKALEAASTLAAAEKARVGIIFVIDTDRAILPENMREMGEVEHIIEPRPHLEPNLENAPANLVNNLASSTAAAQLATIEFADYLLEQARKSVNASGVSDVEVKAALGDAAEEVAEFASERNADLIVCGSRGHSGLKKLLLGSTSHKIAQLAECSCLTVK